MADEIDLSEVVFTKQLGGVEDLQFGFGSVTQIRNGQTVVISLINSETIPYTSVDTVKSIIDKILAKYPLN